MNSPSCVNYKEEEGVVLAAGKLGKRKKLNCDILWVKAGEVN